ncbi:TM109 protein, partial [Penelope pileata]|nr:TM109 protein [Penelope pileata]
SDAALWQLGRTAWAGLEGCVGPELAEGLVAALWLVASAIASGLALLGAILGDILQACGLSGRWLADSMAVGPGAVQRALLWGLAAMMAARLLAWPLRPALRWLRAACFLWAFLRVVSAENCGPTARGAMLAGLWGLYVMLGGGRAPPPDPRLQAAIRGLEREVEELRRRER